jgi:hypothetical protein
MEGQRIPPSLQDEFSIWTSNQPHCGWLISGCPYRDGKTSDLRERADGVGSSQNAQLHKASHDGRGQGNKSKYSPLQSRSKPSVIRA